MLQTLVERAGDAVTREELRRELWSEQTFVDFEQGLNTAIKELRGALNDSANDPRFVETLPKLGYRMRAVVECDEPAEKDRRAAPEESATRTE
ncbi:MAG: helix-turn-helix domain-containing protein, partial [Candidatus Acidiferrales bacterium]